MASRAHSRSLRTPLGDRPTVELTFDGLRRLRRRRSHPPTLATVRRVRVRVLIHCGSGSEETYRMSKYRLYRNWRTWPSARTLYGEVKAPSAIAERSRSLTSVAT